MASVLVPLDEQYELHGCLFVDITAHCAMRHKARLALGRLPQRLTVATSGGALRIPRERASSRAIARSEHEEFT
jgi:hypothetical protein